MASMSTYTPVMVVLSCGHVVQQSRATYIGFPMEWCHLCRHARFVKGWI
jgi:hypothetical protein